MPNEGSWPIAVHGTTAPAARTPHLFRNEHPRLLIAAADRPPLALGRAWSDRRRLLGAVLITLLGTGLPRMGNAGGEPAELLGEFDQSRERDASTSNTYDFVATQVGLVSSKSVAERTAQELNLANNPTVVPQNVDASQRLRIATGVVSGGLHVVPPTEGQLIKFSYDSTSPQLAATIANGIADSFINAALQRRYEASAYARNFLERQIAKTRGDLERSERALVGYAQAQGIINTAGGDGKQRGE